MIVWLGCGGYTNPDWATEGSGLIYEGVKKDAYLQVYAEHFAAVELNSSFYGIPGVRAFEGMVRRLREGGRREFRMAVKVHQVFTHRRNPTQDDYAQMLQSPQPLRDAGIMGPYLAQFPYSFHRTRENRLYLAQLVEQFAERAGAGYELAIELRHGSWDRPEVRAGMADMGVIWVSPDYPPVGKMPQPALHATGEVAYVRLHGRNVGNWWEGESAAERHDYRYSRTEMEDWAEKIAQAETEGVEELYVFFQTTTKGHALANAPMLVQALEARGVQVMQPKVGEGRLL